MRRRRILCSYRFRSALTCIAIAQAKDRFRRSCRVIKNEVTLGNIKSTSAQYCHATVRLACTFSSTVAPRLIPLNVSLLKTVFLEPIRERPAANVEDTVQRASGCHGIFPTLQGSVAFRHLQADLFGGRIDGDFLGQRVFRAKEAGEVIRHDFRAIGQYDSALNGVFQLAHIAGPMVA